MMVFSHLDTGCSSLLPIMMAWYLDGFLSCCLRRTISLPCRDQHQSDFLEFSGLFVCVECKSRGPKIDPWGIPFDTFFATWSIYHPMLLYDNGLWDIAWSLQQFSIRLRISGMLIRLGRLAGSQKLWISPWRLSHQVCGCLVIYFLLLCELRGSYHIHDSPCRQLHICEIVIGL